MHIVQEEIGKPRVSIEVISDTLSIFTFSPLPSGFGHTLGNTLRRTLLSSVPGAGVTAVKFKKAAHEYTSIEGLSDSVLDFVLNLKQVAFQKASKDSDIVILSKKGEGDVLASDITLSGDTTILNPEYVISTLDGKTSTLDIEIKLEKGIGFSSAKERQKEGVDAGWILLDTIFSPVKSVRYEVSPTRVGEMTNLDSLEIEIETNGSLSPQEALQFSAQILKGYFEFFQEDPADVIEEDFLADFSGRGVDGVLEEDDDQESYTPIEILNLSPRTLNALINGNIGSVEEVMASNPSKLEAMRGFGKKAMTELTDALKEHGYEFGGAE